MTTKSSYQQNREKARLKRKSKKDAKSKSKSTQKETLPENCRREGKTIIVTLLDPVEVLGTKYEELIVKKPRGAQFRNLPSEPDAGDMMDMAADLCDCPPDVMDALECDDLTQVLNIVGKHIENSPGIGKRN